MNLKNMSVRQLRAVEKQLSALLKAREPKPKKKKTGTPRFDWRLTQDQLERLLTRAKASKKGTRDHLMLLLGVSHGLRASEICDLRTSDFDMTAGEITVRRKKGSDTTVQPLRRDDNPLFDEYSAVAEYLKGKDGKLFNIERQMLWLLFKKYAKDAGIPKRFSPHTLKHTTAHIALDSGSDIAKLQTYLGHKSLQSTGLYTRTSQAAASAAIQKGMFDKKA